MTTTLEITPAKFTCGDFDSALRYLREDPLGDLGVGSGITWEIGESRSVDGFRWVAYRYNLQDIVSVDFTVFRSQTQTVPLPSNSIMKVNF